MDMINMNIIESAMIAIAKEMGINVQKTAYSTIFSEAEDFTCALANREGELIAVADFCPSQIGDVPLLVRSMLREVPLSEMFGYVTSLRTLSSGRATSTMEFYAFVEAPKNISDEVIKQTQGE